MDLKDLIAISGQPNLFKFISQGRNGIIVENIENKKRISASSVSKMSSLEDIAIYTDDDEVSLGQIYDTIWKKEGGSACLSHKSDGAEIKAYFEEILPNYDKDRVYVSDMKKVLNWYNQLQANNMLTQETEEVSVEVGDDNTEKSKKSEEV